MSYQNTQISLNNSSCRYPAEVEASSEGEFALPVRAVQLSEGCAGGSDWSIDNISDKKAVVIFSRN